MPAPRDSPEKTTSPRRLTTFAGDGSVGTFVAVTASPARSLRARSSIVAHGGVPRPALRAPPRPGTSVDAPGRRGRCRCHGGSARHADGVDGGLALLAEGVRDGRGAGGLGRGLLALLADDVAHEGLHQVGGLLLLVLHAADVVADQHDRVLAGLLGVAGHLDGEVVLAPTLDVLGRLDDGGGSLGGRLDELLAHADLRDAEVAGLAQVGVADGAVPGP